MELAKYVTFLEWRCLDSTMFSATSRTACRGCRFQKALDAGVRLEGLLLGGFAKIQFLAVKRTKEPRRKSKILEILQNGFDTFVQAQRAIQLELSPELGFDNNKVL